MNKDYIIEQLKKQIEGFEVAAKTEKVGTVSEIGDGVARITGLGDAMASEMLEFENGAVGVALNLEEDRVGAMVLGEYTDIKEGDQVKSTGQILSVPVGENFIGRVINPLGKPLDGKGDIKSEKSYPIEKIAPGVITRQKVNQPVQTGIKAIDAMIPIGRGQRELIIGDRQTGKTAVAIDTIINQKGQDMICIYVAIGQKESKVARIVSELEKHGAMEYTTVVLAGAADPAPLSFIAPYAGCALGEYFMDKGQDVLIVYDDLSRHAWSYRQVSLILRRPPGREAYPGDIFYLHSRLLERSAKLSKDFGGGSITALPIIETQAGDVSAYIPTNVISITDGQIYLEADLFYKGVRPALNVGISVSRVGSDAQTKAMKKVAGKLKLDMAQFRELEAFAQFGSDLDEKTKTTIERGKRTVEVLKQGQYEPMAMENEVAIIYAATNGFLDDVAVEKVGAWERDFQKYLNSSAKAVLDLIREKKELSKEVVLKLEKAIKEFKEVYQNGN
ncbi:MAG: F0F1 ATP synthase subunit alpha [Candidatus Pacebacteria bacterium]|nr:F0F1 ATP synthase subunit alpha [Candidatus Paceibacterota bacterium]